MATTNVDFTEQMMAETEAILDLYEQIQTGSANLIAEYNALGGATEAATGPLGPSASWDSLGLHFARTDAILALGVLSGSVPTMLNATNLGYLYRIKR